ncbi:BREX system P-loop protein BrxC [Geotoga petraea]|uniref:BREX system P-loop protein BrxC n=1 Tax=Geotoga petraea TaxID=28234 RepID=A0A1G6MLN1_9BACT|nr:BREX system P-loop protein BrxC [Geotoga petraea]SDC56409.1 hypothetical protein SAMN04488588_1302 [Geotoga petraea]
MKIKDLFKRDIERKIRGVITVNKEEELVYQELEEYVVTKDIRKNLIKFINEFNKSFDEPIHDIGVWISGFYGSGKSHFLKILSYLLENEEIKGKKSVEFFRDKIDEQSFAELEKAANQSKDVIIFNIDSESNSDDREESLLNVFKKMFYQKLGIDASNKTIFEIEKRLFEMGKFDDFKKLYKEKTNNSWTEKGRQTFFIFKNKVKDIFAEVLGLSEEEKNDLSFDNLQSDNSIRKFAQDIQEYIKSKGNNHHVVFLVDEVGQYISESQNLILNLQTLSEELANQCHGKAWIVVTSQEEIQDLTGRRQADFSRIQARYKTRLNFSSISVDEVIKKRLLDKTDVAKDELKLRYHDEQQTLRNAISFNNQASMYNGFKSEDDFIETYPFIPYQIKLLQNVFEDIRKNSVAGRYLSEGERSLLSAYQESAIIYEEEETDTLIPFHSFYETIKNFLKSQIIRVFENAEDLVDSAAIKEEDIKVLKTLFLIRYVENFEKNIENITTLMLEKIEQDKLELKKQITESLKRLKTQALISQNGEQYFFLTNEEQEINQRIERIEIDDIEIRKEIKELIFDEINSSNYKMRYNKNDRNHSFSFDVAIDEQEFGNRNEISVEVITPLGEKADFTKNRLMSYSSLQTKKLIIKLNNLENTLNEITEYLKINKYSNSINRNNITETQRRIVQDKLSEITERKNRAISEIEDILVNSEFYSFGREIKSSGKEKEKLNNSFEEFIQNVYSKLVLVESIDKKELIKIIKNNKYRTFSEEYRNKKATEEMKNYLENTSYNSQKTLKDLYTKFENPPYGWTEIETLSLILILYKKELIQLKESSEIISVENNQDIDRLLGKDSERIIVQKRERLNDKILGIVTKKMSELFSEMYTSNSTNEIYKKLNQKLEEYAGVIDNYVYESESKDLPGKKELKIGQDMLSDLQRINQENELLKAFAERAEDILQWKEDYRETLDFYRDGKYQKEILLKAKEFAKSFPSIIVEDDFIVNENHTSELYEKLKEIINSERPYREIVNIPDLLDKLKKAKEEYINEQKETIFKKAEKTFDELENYANQDYVDSETKENIKNTKQNILNKINESNDLTRLSTINFSIDTYKYRFNKNIEEDIVKNKPKIIESKPPVVETPNEPIAKEKIVKKIRKANLIKTKSIKNEDDLEKLLYEIRKEIEDDLKNNSEIEIID